MTYVVAKNGVFEKRVEDEAVDWDESHFCPAGALSFEERHTFGVSELVTVSRPFYDAMTQNCVDSDTVFVDGAWTQVWTVVSATLEEIRTRAKDARAAEVEAIVVTVDGMTFNGDEASQNRMTRAITGLQAAGVTSITWTLADNRVANVSLTILTKALVLAGQRQTELWPIPAQ